jgi:hypothetical protein
VFGAQVAAQAPARQSRDIGAIGDGRKRVSPTNYDDSVRLDRLSVSSSRRSDLK